MQLPLQWLSAFLVEWNPKDIFNWFTEPLFTYCTGQLKHTVDLSKCITSGEPLECAGNPGVSGNSG